MVKKANRHSLPGIKLEDGERIELSIHRSRIGIIFIWLAAIAGYLSVLVVLALLSIASDSGSSRLDGVANAYISMVSVALFGIITVVALVNTKVYSDNHLFVTNKRLIHHECASLFTKSINVIELISIEDVSFKQENIIDQIFKLGTMRMSTVGDETTYIFKYINTPNDELETITHLVHIEKENTRDSGHHRQKVAPAEDGAEEDSSKDAVASSTKSTAEDKKSNSAKSKDFTSDAGEEN